jgi:hypothetical protein
VILSRARALRMGWIAFLVIALMLSAVPASAKNKKNRGERRYTLPVARKWAPDRKIAQRHHDYPAWDIALPRRTAVKAVHPGRVVSVTRWGACGRGVIIDGLDGYRYTYCHGADVAVKKRRWIEAGQKIMLSGSTGHSTGPHLHLQIKGPNGRLVCPQSLLQRWARGKQASPRSGTSRGCAYSPDHPSYRDRRGKARTQRSGRLRARDGRKSSASRAHAKGRGKDKGRNKDKRSARGGKRTGADGRKRNKKRSSPAATRRASARDRHQRKGTRPAQGRRAQRKRAAERRRKARLKAESIRRETAARRAELAMARRVRPLI